MYINLGCSKEKLTPQETKKLARQARKGDKNARNKLIEANHRLILLVIKRYFYGHRCPKEDLFGYGVFGLIEAIEHFDPKKGNFQLAHVFGYGRELCEG